MKKYDALYIFVGIAKDDALEANLEKALAEVTRLGGNVLEKVQLGKRMFSRPMKKRENGVYVKVRLELDPSKVDELVKRYKLVEEVFRVQILASDRDWRVSPARIHFDMQCGLAGLCWRVTPPIRYDNTLQNITLLGILTDGHSLVTYGLPVL